MPDDATPCAAPSSHDADAAHTHALILLRELRPYRGAAPVTTRSLVAHDVAWAAAAWQRSVVGAPGTTAQTRGACYAAAMRMRTQRVPCRSTITDAAAWSSASGRASRGLLLAATSSAASSTPSPNLSPEKRSSDAPADAVAWFAAVVADDRRRDAALRRQLQPLLRLLAGAVGGATAACVADGIMYVAAATPAAAPVPDAAAVSAVLLEHVDWATAAASLAATDRAVDVAFVRRRFEYLVADALAAAAAAPSASQHATAAASGDASWSPSAAPLPVDDPTAAAETSTDEAGASKDTPPPPANEAPGTPWGLAVCLEHILWFHAQVRKLYQPLPDAAARVCASETVAAAVAALARVWPVLRCKSAQTGTTHDDDDDEAPALANIAALYHASRIAATVAACVEAELLLNGATTRGDGDDGVAQPHPDLPDAMSEGTVLRVLHAGVSALQRRLSTVLDHTLRDPATAKALVHACAVFDAATSNVFNSIDRVVAVAVPPRLGDGGGAATQWAVCPETQLYLCLRRCLLDTGAAEIFAPAALTFSLSAPTCLACTVWLHACAMRDDGGGCGDGATHPDTIEGRAAAAAQRATRVDPVPLLPAACVDPPPHAATTCGKSDGSVTPLFDLPSRAAWQSMVKTLQRAVASHDGDIAALEA